MLVSRDCLETIGLFEETTFPVAYNDVDFCLRAVNAGFRVVWTPFACLIHHESASRGSDETEENIERFNRDKANLRKRHHTDTLEDRAFNPWYSKTESVPHPIALDVLPKAR
jgi:GT2 family glycosyltransferase